MNIVFYARRAAPHQAISNLETRLRGQLSGLGKVRGVRWMAQEATPRPLVAQMLVRWGFCFVFWVCAATFALVFICTCPVLSSYP